ncbi:hypothetical protein ACFE04_010512 [Oxalis oulophora]
MRTENFKILGAVVPTIPIETYLYGCFYVLGLDMVSWGCNPLSMTSQGWHISQFQTDTIARSYIITALEESVQSVNSAIHLLLTGRTNFNLDGTSAIYMGMP